ncbi:MAG TPA: hypothetical protein VHR45_21530 [Thermoanaerobaculia bacterium]|nr:hypothetical protein [Thermoanaerobaculia bacterium]
MAALVDTTVLVYRFDPQEPGRDGLQREARGLREATRTAADAQEGVGLTQSAISPPNSAEPR